MRKFLLILVLVLPGCWQSNSDSVTTVWGVENSGNGVSNTAGGGIVQVTGLTVPAFAFDQPVPFLLELPNSDGLAMAEAESITAPDSEVVDAIYTLDGLLALVRRPGEMALEFVTADPIVRASAPEDAVRLLPAGDDPLQVLLVLRDGRAVIATRTALD